MTTAHRPTFNPAQGRAADHAPTRHSRYVAAHMTLKYRQTGQGGNAETEVRDLRAELLKAEAVARAKREGKTIAEIEEEQAATSKRAIEDTKDGVDIEEEEESEAKRRRLVLEQYAEADADSAGESSEEDSDSDDDDEEDETAALMRELDKIKRERAEQKAQEEAVQAAKDQESREFDIARGNPLLNSEDFGVKRRWDDDVVFKNQARGTEDKKPKEFVNDLLRSDFHKRFMSRYLR